MSYAVVFSPEAEEQLAELYRYIAAAASPDVAARYTEAIVTYCESLRTFPLRGTMRDDVRPGLRITNYRKRAVIAFDVAVEGHGAAPGVLLMSLVCLKNFDAS